jgi:hypothetical protein
MNIRKKLLRTTMIVAAGLITCFAATQAQATTLYVGTCHTGASDYATIGAALAVATPGTIIDVCPGYYAEQVLINKDNITLQGISYSHAGQITDAAVIVPPAGGVVANGTIFDEDAGSGTAALAQVIVLNSTGVIISHITVDGQSNQSCGSGILIGIYYQDSTGTVTDSVARNQNEGTNSGAQCGWGIAAESSSGAPAITVSNNSVHNFQKNGIVVRGNSNGSGPTLTATGNTVIGIGPTASIGQNGIEIAFGATGTVKANYVADVVDTADNSATGILFYGSTGSPVAQTNVVESANTGIGVDYDAYFGSAGGADVSITSNHIGGSQMLDGIDLCGNSDTASSNIIFNSTNSGVHLDDSCQAGSSGNNATVKSNTISDTCAGILIGTAGTDVTSPNSYENDGYEVLTGSDTCTPPSGPNAQVTGKSGAQSKAKAGKARP